MWTDLNLSAAVDQPSAGCPPLELNQSRPRDVLKPDWRGVLHGALVRRGGVAQLVPHPPGVSNRRSLERSPSPGDH